ncbi:bZIP transcription factor [Seiridium cupressi]
MERTPHFFNYHFQGQDDGSYPVFDGSEANGQLNFPQDFSALPSYGNVQLHPAPSLGRPMQPPPLTRSALPARSSIQSGIDRYGHGPVQHQRRLSSVSSLDRPILESPGLTSGSSSTPETRVSGQSITPNITPPDIESKPVHPSKPPEALFPPPAPVLPRRRRPRKPRPKAELTQQEEEARRDKFLARNRVAAGKCREKRKTWMTDLEDTKLDLESRNTRLRMEYSALLNEVTQTRALLMTHANCSDGRIDKWVENEAKRFVLGAGEQYDSMLANYGLAPAPQMRQDSLSSLSGYTTAATNEMTSPAHRRSMSLPKSISPTQRGSMSIPQGMAVPSSPVLFRGQLQPDPDGRWDKPTQLWAHVWQHDVMEHLETVPAMEDDPDTQTRTGSQHGKGHEGD